MTIDDTLLKRRLTPIPDVPYARQGNNPYPGAPRRVSATLIVLSEHERRLQVLLTQRNPKSSHHPGQIAFPGGGAEAGDASAWDTALREAEEETTLDRAELVAVTELDPIYIDASNNEVTTCIAFLPDFRDVAPHDGELHHVFWHDLDELAHHEGLFTRRVDSVTYASIAYRIPQGTIFGYTAYVLRALLDRLEGVSSVDADAA